MLAMTLKPVSKYPTRRTYVVKVRGDAKRDVRRFTEALSTHAGIDGMRGKGERT
jgi:hypothetical protein